jgi:hypothetical protein
MPYASHGGKGTDDDDDDYDEDSLHQIMWH